MADFGGPGLKSPIKNQTIIEGEGNQVFTGEHSDITSGLVIKGNNNLVEIGSRCVVRGWMLIQSADNVEFRIGDRSTLSSVSIQAHEPARVIIGEDCQLSTEIMMSVSDMHPIFDADTGARINPAADIIIGDHVWIGFRCIVLKGARIGSGSIIGAGSVVHGEIPPGVIAAGNPARVIRRNVDWKRSLRD